MRLELTCARFSKPLAKPVRRALSRVRMCHEEIPGSPQQERNQDEDYMENVNADVVEENARLIQFVEEASQEAESHTEHERDLPMWMVTPKI